MKTSTFLSALCVAAAFSLAADASAGAFGPRATGPIKRAIAKAPAARIAVTHRAGPRGTIVIERDIAPAAKVAAAAEGESCLTSHRAGPRATVCM